MRKKINLIIFFFLIIKISIASEELNMFPNTSLNSIEYYETYENLLQNNQSIQNELENNMEMFRPFYRGIVLQIIKNENKFKKNKK